MGKNKIEGTAKPLNVQGGKTTPIPKIISDKDRGKKNK